MITEKKRPSTKKLSVAKSILAVLWHLGEAPRSKIVSHKYFHLLCREKHPTTLRSSISRLCSANILKKDYNDIFGLTENGKKEARLAFIEAELALHNESGEAKWDEGWRMIFFDIPETKRKHRDYLRRVIKSVGFYEFQKSIWVYPFPVPEFLKNLLFEESIRPHVSFVTTNLLDDDTNLRKVFKLPSK